MMSERGIVIIGAGEAGCRAANALREKGYEGPVTLVNGEPHTPYERPPLSKGSREPVAIVTDDQIAALKIDHFASATAIGIEREGKTVILDDGRALQYDKLLLATGASARFLPTATPNERVMSVRTLDDAARFHDRLVPGLKLAMIGAGFIGLELAAVARQRGADVVVFETQPRILMRGVPPRISEVLAQRHAEEGVAIRTNAVVISVNADDEAVTIELPGEIVKFDLVVVGIGATPNTKLAEACGLACDNGIAVNSNLRTDDPYVFAAGDCCSFPAPLFADRRIRVESWRSAREQGEHAAGSMLGEIDPFVGVPWFWSDQYDLGLQIVGLGSAGGSGVVRELDDGGVLVFELDPDGIIVGAGGIARGNAVAKEIKIAELMIRQQLSPCPSALSDKNVKLKSLLVARDAA